MITVSKLVVSAAGLLACSLVFAQQDAQTQQAATMATPTGKVEASAAKAKPTPTPLTEDQQLGRQILQASEAMARGLEAPMRSYSLLQIAQAYVANDKPKAAGLLRDAFTASVGIPDDKDTQDTKNRLQESILRALLPISQADVEERLAQASPGIRKSLSTAIIGQYAEKKQFAPAIELITRLTAEDEFPYDSGIKLIQAMPPEMSGERQELFTQATSSYGQHSKHSGGISFGGGFTAMVMRFGASMPRKLALEAIDEILRQAKDSNEPFSMTMSSDAGTVSLDSSYEHALFALLPLLKQLDETRAESLLKENQNLEPKLAQFPQGLQAFSPALAKNAPAKTDAAKTENPAKKDSGPTMSIRMGVKQSPEAAAQMARQMEVQRQAQAVINSSEKDPVQAIVQASALPVSVGEMAWDSPRGHALEAIAKTYVKSRPGVAKQAVDELRKITEEMPAQSQIVYVASAANLYLELGDQETAEKMVSDGFKAAEKMLEKDNDPDDPNKALKAWWPSTDAYRRFIEIETKISHRATAEVLKQIKDQDVRTVESIVVSHTLLGLPPMEHTIIRKTKKGAGFSTFSTKGP